MNIEIKSVSGRNGYELEIEIQRDTSHLVALYEGYDRLLHYRDMCDTQPGRDYYTVLIEQKQREINGERAFLGMPPDKFTADPMGDDDLLAELQG